MLLLLHFRGRYHPKEFVHSDVEQAALGETSGTTMPAFLNEYTMYFHRGETANTYGELVSWDDDEDAFENMTNEVGMHPGHGLQALEIQQRIYTFLVKWSRGLLQDVPPLTESDILANSGPPTALADITSLQIIALKAPYRIPAHLDLARLQAIASAGVMREKIIFGLSARIPATLPTLWKRCLSTVRSVCLTPKVSRTQL